MKYNEIEKLCYNEEERLLDKYFGKIVEEAASQSHDTIEGYTPDLTKKVESEYMDFLTQLWNKITHEEIGSFEEIVGYSELRDTIKAADNENLNHAYEDAARLTLWEKITHTNHKDVTFYKGLLLEYTRDLLSCCRCGLMEKLALRINENNE